MFRALCRPSLKRGSASIPASVRVVALIILGTAFLSGCAPAPRLTAGPDPSHPGVPVPAAAYRSVTDSYVSQRPVTPLPWREQNQRVTPAPKP